MIDFNKWINGYKAVIFDFDYTLADSSKGVCECISYALKEMGYDCPGYDEICRTIGWHLSEAFASFTDNRNPDDANIFLKLFKDKADKIMANNTVIYDEVKPVFEYLQSRGIKCAIVSTKYRYRIEHILDREGLKGFVDTIIGSEDVSVCKPDPEGLIKAVRHLGLNTEDCLYVGDSLVDAETVKRANVDFVAVLTGTTKREEFKEYEPLLIINKLNSLTISDIKDMKLENVLPPGLIRTNGAALGSMLKGNFDSYGAKMKIYVDTSKPPFIYLYTSKVMIILNDQSADKTVALYQELQNKMSGGQAK